MNFGNIIVREDGSYVINNGMYHVPNEGEFADLWGKVDEYAKANPDKLTKEVEPEVELEPELTQEEIEAQALAQAKAERANAVRKITVEVDGLIFDGDEDSQTRMARTITAYQALGLPEDSTISWAMADTNANKVEQVTIAQLSKALYLAGCKQSELWCKPYGVTGTTKTGLEYLNSLGQ